MPTNEQAYLLQKYKGLPPDIQGLLMSDLFDVAIQDIAALHALSAVQAKQLEDEVGLILMGIISLDQFKSGVRDRLEVDDTKTEKIVNEVNIRIFSIVRESLGKIPVEGELETKEPASSIPGAPIPLTLKPAVTTPVQMAPTAPQPQEPAQPQSIFEEKLKRVFTVPRADARLSGSTAAIPTPPATPTVPTPPLAPHTGVDPYREPAN